MRLAFHNVSAGRPSPHGGLFDKVIEWRTGSPLVHAELVVDMPRMPDTLAQCYSAVPTSGVRWATIDITQPWWTIVPVRALPYATELANVERAIDRYLGEKYDWVGIAGMALPWGAHDDHDKFCSEVCTLVLQAGGLFPGVKSWRTSPAGLYKLATGANWYAA